VRGNSCTSGKAEDSWLHHSFGSNHGNKLITWHLLHSEKWRVDFVDGLHKYLHHFFWPRPESNWRGKIIWGGECQANRSLFTGYFGESTMSTDLWVRESGQVPSLPIPLHRSPLQISLYRQMGKRSFCALNKQTIIVQKYLNK